MLSFRDVATASDDADSLQSSLQELQRLRRAKQQRLQHDRNILFAEEGEGEDPDGFGATQELSYSREVLHAWSRSYPKLREAVAALAAAGSGHLSSTVKEKSHPLLPASSPSPSVASAALVDGAAFSVAETVRLRYPSRWVIPPYTIPPSFYAASTAMEDSLALAAYGGVTSTGASVKETPLWDSPSPSRHGGGGVGGNTNTTTRSSTSHGFNVTDYSRQRCVVRIRREPLQQVPTSPTITAAAAAGSGDHAAPAIAGLSAFNTPGSTALPGRSPLLSLSTLSLSSAARPVSALPQQRQRVLARWPQGKPRSTKVNAVLRSIDIEARKREQWNEHVRKQQQQQQQAETQGPEGRPAAEMVSQKRYGETASSNTAVAAAANLVDGGGMATASQRSDDALGRELYWPAYITNTRAIFTGAPCLHDTFHGLGLLQLYERFEPVLALALASPLQLVVDVVYAMDETSEAFGLSIDPSVVVAEGGKPQMPHTSGSRADDSVTAAKGTTRAAAGDDNEEEESGVPAYRSLFSRSLSSTPRPDGTEDGTEDSTDGAPLLLPSSLPPVISDLNYAFQPIAPQQLKAAAAAAATIADSRGGGGRKVESERGASSSPDAEDVVTATLRRSTLSTAPQSAYELLAGPVSQAHMLVLLRPTAAVVCAARARALVELEARWQRLRQALIDRLVAYEEEAPVPVPAAEEEEEEERPPLLQLPDADSYVSPYIDHEVTQDGGLPAEPAGAQALTEEEIRRQTRLPALQGRRRSDGKATDAGSQLFAPSANAQRLPARRRSSSPSTASAGDTGLGSGSAAAAAAIFDAAVKGRQRVSLMDSSGSVEMPYVPRAVAAATRRSTLDSIYGPNSGSVSPTASLSQHRDNITAKTVPPRSLADGPRAAPTLAEPAATLNASALSAEESHALSAAVRAAAQRQKAMEEALRRRQQPPAAPRGALPALTVEAPSPEVSLTAASISRRSRRRSSSGGEADVSSARPLLPPSHGTWPSDILNSASELEPASAVFSTPPFSNLSALQEESMSRLRPQQGRHSTERSAVGGMGIDDSSSLQRTPSPPPSRAARAGGHVALHGATTAAAAGAAAGSLAADGSPSAASFSTPPPPAPPSHSSSPPFLRDGAVVHRGGASPPQPCPDDKQQRHSKSSGAATARTLLTPSYTHAASDSVDGASTASSQGFRSATHTPSGGGGGSLPASTGTARPRADLLHDSVCGVPRKGSDTERTGGGGGESAKFTRTDGVASTRSSAASSMADSDVPQLRRTAAYPSNTPISTAASKAAQAHAAGEDGERQRKTQPSAASAMAAAAAQAHQPASVPSSSSSASASASHLRNQSPERARRANKKNTVGAVQSPRSLAASAAAAALAAAAAAQRHAAHPPTAAQDLIDDGVVIGMNDGGRRGVGDDSRSSSLTFSECRNAQDGDPFYKGSGGGNAVYDAPVNVDGEGLLLMSAHAQLDSPLPQRPSPRKNATQPAPSTLSSEDVIHQQHPKHHHHHNHRRPDPLQVKPPAHVDPLPLLTSGLPSPLSGSVPALSASVDKEVELPAAPEEAELARLYKELYPRQGNDTAVRMTGLEAVGALKRTKKGEGDRRRRNGRQPCVESGDAVPGASVGGDPSHQAESVHSSSSGRRRRGRSDKHASRASPSPARLGEEREKEMGHTASLSLWDGQPGTLRHEHPRHRYQRDSDGESNTGVDLTNNTAAAVPPLRLHELPGSITAGPAYVADPSQTPHEGEADTRQPPLAKKKKKQAGARRLVSPPPRPRSPSSSLDSSVSGRQQAGGASRHPSPAPHNTALSPPPCPLTLTERGSAQQQQQQQAHHHHRHRHRHHTRAQDDEREEEEHRANVYGDDEDDEEKSQRVSRRSPQSAALAQKTVLVRRVVRRRRSEVFVDEGGSLVSRAPVALHGPSSRSPSRGRSAKRSARGGQL